MVDISIVIVSWNVRDLLKKCLESIYNYTQGISFEIFVIDNASHDSTVEMVKHHFSGVKVIANDDNKGFAAANNQGIRESQGRYVLLLNPDTELFNNALSQMVKFMDEHPHCGVSGCHLLNPDRSHQDSIRRFPDFWSQALILLKIHHFLPNLRIFKRYLCRSKKDLEIYKLRYSEVDQVMGAFFMTRREVIEQIGLLDEGFYIWFEEVDFCRRAKSAGWSIDYTNTAEIFHHFGQSFKQRFSLDKQKIWGNSLSYYFKKHHSFWQYLVIKLLSKVAVGVQYLLKLKT